MSESHDYLVGYARVDMTPAESVPLAGFGATSLRMSQNVLDPIYATCIAITDREGHSALLYTTDLITVLDEKAAAVRAAVEKTIGVPGENVMITATHTHSAPCQLNHEKPVMDAFREQYTGWLTDAAVKAWEDRKPAELYGVKTKTEGMNFVRHYLCEDGTYSGPGFGEPKTKKIAHVGEADPEMLLLCFKRQGGKDILLMNWQAHATYTGSPKKFDLSADFPGAVRAYLEAQLDCEFAFFPGAAGNLMPTSSIVEENPADNVTDYGKLLGDTAIAALPRLEKLQAGPVRVLNRKFTARVNHTEDHRVADAEEVIKLWQQTHDRTLCREFAASKGFYAVFHATNLPARAKLPASFELEGDALTVGEAAFVTGPCEIFSETGENIKKESPYPFTMVLSCANARGGYFPTRRAFEIGTYEAGCCRFEPGIDDCLKDHLVGLLNELKEAE